MRQCRKCNKIYYTIARTSRVCDNCNKSKSKRRFEVDKHGKTKQSRSKNNRLQRNKLSNGTNRR